MGACITIVVATYNRSAYLGEALDSILTQDFELLTVVVADNASTDETPRIVEGIESPKVHYVRRERNLGWIENFNRALADVETEYVGIFGDDDRMLPGALRRAVQVFDEHPSVGMVHTAFDVIDERGRVLSTREHWMGAQDDDVVERGPAMIRRTMPLWSGICSSSVVMRSKAIPAGGYDPVDGEFADYTLWQRIALDWDVAFVAEPGLQLRTHPGQLSARHGRSLDAGVVLEAYEPEMISSLLTAKLRFVDRHHHRLADPRALRRAARWCSRRELASWMSMAANVSRRHAVRELWSGAHRQPSVLLGAASARVLVKLVLGPRLVGALRRRLRGRGERVHHSRG